MARNYRIMLAVLTALCLGPGPGWGQVVDTDSTAPRATEMKNTTTAEENAQTYPVPGGRPAAPNTGNPHQSAEGRVAAPGPNKTAPSPALTPADGERQARARAADNSPGTGKTKDKAAARKKSPGPSPNPGLLPAPGSQVGPQVGTFWGDASPKAKRGE